MGFGGFVTALGLWKVRVIFCDHNPRVSSQYNYKSITSLPTPTPLPFGQVKSLPWLLSLFSQIFAQAIRLLSHESSGLNVIWRRGGVLIYLTQNDRRPVCHQFPHPPQPRVPFVFLSASAGQSPGVPPNMQPSAHHGDTLECNRASNTLSSGEALGAGQGERRLFVY